MNAKSKAAPKATDNSKEVAQKLIGLKPESNNKLTDAVNVLTDALKKDPDLYFAWQSNIAMPFQDEAARQNVAIEPKKLHEIANKAAKNFLDVLINQK
ncbi:hypothetical protein [Tellurirhabdus bombi]|uniref:hypothetical protein n=1 Tax=Tellurirhabdus bombi TaxID=2907205 RepID=UPI001F413217|nr:hypothetical protein [Tellurirhabdus bombi]